MRAYIRNLPTRKPRTLAQMREYLSNHDTRKGWIGGGDDGIGLCQNVKFRNLSLTSAEDDCCHSAYYDDNPDTYWESGIYPILNAFAERNPGYGIFQAGRSHGYFVLRTSYKNGHGGPVWADEEALEESDNVRELAKVVYDFDHTVNRAVAQFVEYATTTQGDREKV